MRRIGARPPQRLRPAQSGQALLVMAAILVIGVSATFYALFSPDNVAIERDKITTAALAQVKEALIGWSAARDPAVDGVNARPGELPCPDINPLDGYEDGSCVAGALGRVPWKTLRIPEPKDATGETLWYTIAGPFRNYNMSSAPITSDTQGNITVYQESTSSQITNTAIAVLFAPGAAVGTQSRSTTDTMTCTAPSGTYAQNLCASNYLETAGSINNATINGPFIQAQKSFTFNDRVLAITNADLMPAVEQRVAKEMMSILQRYRVATGAYPWADLSTGSSDVNYNRQRIPCATASPTNWADAGISLPNWFTNGCNCTAGPIGTVSWACVVFYAVAKNRLSGSGCATCGSTTTACGSTTSSTTTLTVANTSSQVAHLCLTGSSPFTCNPTVLTTGSADLVLITPGAYSGSPARSWPTTLAAITGYFEDAQNSDNNDYNCYYVPTSTNLNRDRIYVVR